MIEPHSKRLAALGSFFSRLACRLFLMVPVSVGLQSAAAASGLRSVEAVIQRSDLVILADVKHGVRDRIAFYSSPELFEAMARSAVRHIAIEMPRVLGRQAMGIETEADIDLFKSFIDFCKSGLNGLKNVRKRRFIFF